MIKPQINRITRQESLVADWAETTDSGNTEMEYWNCHPKKDKFQQMQTQKKIRENKEILTNQSLINNQNNDLRSCAYWQILHKAYNCMTCILFYILKYVNHNKFYIKIIQS